MTKAKAIKILQEHVDYLEHFSKSWLEGSKTYSNPEMTNIVKMMGEIMERDSKIIQNAINELTKKGPKTI